MLLYMYMYTEPYNYMYMCIIIHVHCIDSACTLHSVLLAVYTVLGPILDL